MPPLLGGVLMIGGIGYVVSGFVDFLAQNVSAVVYALTVPATIGELWMVGYLLVAGIPRRHTIAPARGPATAATR